MRTEEAIKFIRIKDQKEEAEIEYQISLEWQNMVCFSEKVFFFLKKGLFSCKRVCYLNKKVGIFYESPGQVVRHFE